MHMWVLFRASNQGGRRSIPLWCASCGLGLGRWSCVYKRNQECCPWEVLTCSILSKHGILIHVMPVSPSQASPTPTVWSALATAPQGWSSRDIIPVSKHSNWQWKTRGTSNSRPTNIKSMHDRCEDMRSSACDKTKKPPVRSPTFSLHWEHFRKPVTGHCWTKPWLNKSMVCIWSGLEWIGYSR